MSVKKSNFQKSWSEHLFRYISREKNGTEKFIEYFPHSKNGIGKCASTETFINGFKF